MKFDSAADLLAALKPFVSDGRGTHLDGLERLVRTSSHLTGELQAVKGVLPLHGRLARRRNADTAADLVAATNGSNEGDPVSVATLSQEPGTASGLEQVASHDQTRGGLEKPMVLFLLLILLLTR